MGTGAEGAAAAAGRRGGGAAAGPAGAARASYLLGFHSGCGCLQGVEEHAALHSDVAREFATWTAACCWVGSLGHPRPDQ